MERKLLKAIKKGDLEKVKSVLSLSQTQCDVNCVYSSGKTVLQVAGNLESVSVRNDMIQYLLSGGADLELALLHAVRDNNVKIVEILLKFHKSTSLQPESQCAVRPMVVKRQGYITPLILAACLQNFQIVKLLLEHGFTICDSKTDSRRSLCSNGEISEKLGPAVFLLNRYRALASPVYMAASFLQNSLSGPDPVHRSCVLNKELCDMAEQEYEFRKEYLELSDGCKEFAVALLNECRTMKEIRCVMEMENEERIMSKMEGGSLNILEFAIVTRNEKFVSHPYSQLILNSEIFRRVPLLEKSSWKQFALLLMSSVLYPLFFLIWLVFDNFLSNHEVGRMFHSPCVKFLIHCGSYQTFLFMLVLTSFRSTSGFLEYFFIDWVVLLFVLGQLVDIVKEVYHQGRVRFFSNNWNYLAIATVTSFLLHYVIWWAGRTSLKDKLDSMQWENHAQNSSYMAVLTSECFLAVAILLAFAQNFSFVQANSTTGPLLQAFTQMLLDVMKFFFYFIFVFLAFVVSFTKLYLQYEKARQRFVLSPTGTNETNPLHLERFVGSFRTIFWSLFGQIDRENFKIEEEEYEVIWRTGMTLFGAFNIVAVLVALNMLIAMLNESYTRITANLDTEWKFTRTKLWLSWVYKKSVLPPPFNLLYLLLPFLWVMKRLMTACCSKGVLLFVKRFFKKKPKSTWKVRRIDEKERREVIRQLILRNLARKSCDLESGTESSDSETEEENDVSSATNGLEGSQSNRIVNMEITKL
ncbi:hypothetical protein OS493_019692 [Desmophyllum pertusum]|uniref:Transient receptor ion channel domain-containing protein n=1 Tax=Desmophyllum pertusum TaxID=174260 RepID=A0A9W9Z236_9CNID|nr:hypothetical protein OS493_019692 [Desmophyllum pertusum]